MSVEISSETAVEILSQAFAPLRCVAEAFDYNHFVRFRVFGANDEALLRMPKLTGTSFGSVTGLAATIDAARSNLTNRGFALAPWQMPAVNGGAT